MLSANIVGEWLRSRGLRMIVTPGLKEYTVELTLTPRAEAVLKQSGCADAIKTIRPVRDESFEVAIKVAMNLYDNDPEAGKPVKR